MIRIPGTQTAPSKTEGQQKRKRQPLVPQGGAGPVGIRHKPWPGREDGAVGGGGGGGDVERQRERERERERESASGYNHLKQKWLSVIDRS